MASTSSIPIHMAARAVTLHGDALLKDPNVMGVAVGYKLTAGQNTGEYAVTVFVARKLARATLPSSALLPARLHVSGLDVPIDVVEGGPFYQHTNISSVKPAHPGTSIGEKDITAGTFGAVVYDDKDNSKLILSNNHVLANNNAAPLGSPILYPGPHDGGTVKDNTIATLLRYIPLVAGDNQVDAAVAKPLDASAIDDSPLNGVPAPSSKNPAVGLLWGGDGTTQSIYSPIDTVLTLLGVHLATPSSTVAPTLGLDVQKTGRTTEKTTGKVTHLNATIKMNIPGVGLATFKNQFLTGAMSQGGDSGSVAVKL